MNTSRHDPCCTCDACDEPRFRPATRPTPTALDLDRAAARRATVAAQDARHERQAAGNRPRTCHVALCSLPPLHDGHHMRQDGTRFRGASLTSTAALGAGVKR